MTIELKPTVLDKALFLPLERNVIINIEKLIKNGLLEVTFSKIKREKSYDQVKSVFSLCGVIYEAMNCEKGSADEVYELYEDFLYEFGMKRKSSRTGELIPVRLSQMDTVEASHFINELVNEVILHLDLSLDAQLTVRDTINKFNAKMWSKETDKVLEQMKESDYRSHQKVCEATGAVFSLHLHHIVTKGECIAMEHDPYNWCILSAEAHKYLHDMGNEVFLEKYPHLKSKFNRAYKRKTALTSSNN